MSKTRMDGRFGPFGGRYVPETLIAALDELTTAYDDARGDLHFHAALDGLLRTYVGRPTPLYNAQRLSHRVAPGSISRERI